VSKSLKNPALPRGFSPAARIYLRPTAIARTAHAADARVLAGGDLTFSGLEVAVRDGSEIHRGDAPVSAVMAWADDEGCAAPVQSILERITGPRPALAGLSFHAPVVMGILNVTPDSFHDGGLDEDAAGAIERGFGLAAAGADIIDIGGESTRPGAEAVAQADELARAIPVFEGLSGADVPLSIDSRRAGVMAAALEKGASLVNDVHALTGEGCEDVVATTGVSAVLMHGPADPTVMQNRTDYEDVVLDTYDWLEARIEACVAAGIPRAHLVVDPGIGFAKTARQSAEVQGAIAILHGLGCPIMLGASRKSFIAGVSADEPSSDRLAGSIAAVTWGLSQGVQMFRVHDVPETRQAINVWRAIGG